MYIYNTMYRNRGNNRGRGGSSHRGNSRGRGRGRNLNNSNRGIGVNRGNLHYQSASGYNQSDPAATKYVAGVADGSIKFPYRRTRFSDNEIKAMFAKLQKFDPTTRMRYEEYRLRNVDIQSDRLAFRGRPTLIIVKPSDYNDWEQLSDMWNEECRMQCRVFDQKLSPFEFFNKHTYNVASHALRKYKKITPHYIRESVYELTRECTSHKPTHIMTLMKMFNAKSVLDFSSGWGDRMIGAMAGGAEFYCGVDPNPCLVAGYRGMIDFWGWDDRVQMIESTIEEAELPNREFDIVFTSPPYFDLEIYYTGGSNDASSSQSINYGTQRGWFDKFLTVAIDRVWAKLRIGGVLCININQKHKKEKYIEWMIAHMKKLPNSNYLGVISYANERVSNPQPIWVCQKKPFVLEFENVQLRHFTEDDIPRMYEIMSNSANMDSIAAGESKTLAQTTELINKYINLEYTFYPIIVCDTTTDAATDSVIVGYIGHFNGKYMDRSFAGKQMARIVIDEPHRKHGYAKAAYRALLSGDHPPHPIYAMIDPANEASLSLHKSIGFACDEKVVFKDNDYILCSNGNGGSNSVSGGGGNTARTYIIRTSEYDRGDVETYFNERGWEAAAPDTIPTLVYEDALYMTSAHTYVGTAVIKTVIGDSRLAVSDKSNLYRGEIREFMPEQFEVRANPSDVFMTRLSTRLFKIAKVWIVRPVGKIYFKGLGISVVTTPSDMASAIAPNTKYVISVYLANPLLWQNQYKFHIRNVVTYATDGNFIENPNAWFAYPAECPYREGDYGNKRIHDTHYLDETRTGFNAEIKQMLGGKYDTVATQIARIVAVVMKSFTPDLYPELTHGIQLFGFDFMIDTDYRVWLLEVNDKIGLRSILMEVVMKPIVDTCDRLLNSSDMQRHAVIASPASKPDKLTYLVRSADFNSRAVDVVFNKQGWTAVESGLPTLVYEDGKFMFGRETFKGNSLIKSMLDGNKNAITDKARLFRTITHACPEAKFMLPQHTLILDGDVGEFRNIFDTADTWIVKPVGKGFFKGRGISIATSFKELTAAVAPKTKYVFAEYLTNPLLYDGKKFHIRDLVICGSDGKFARLDTLMEIYPAEAAWDDGDLHNKAIHDTHFVSHEYTGYISDLTRRYGEDNTANIMDQINIIIKATIDAFEPQPYPESVYGFEIFGYDFIVDDSYHVWLMEINAKVGLEGYNADVVFGEIINTCNRLMDGSD